MTPQPNALRLEFADAMFMRRHRGALAPIATQVLWHLPQLPSLEAMQKVVRHLAEGQLARQVVRRPIPFARDVWQPLSGPPQSAEQILEVAERQEPLDFTRIAEWLRERGDTPLDPAAGRPYELAVTRTVDGGALACLVTSHAVADGGSVIEALSVPPRGVLAAPTGQDLLREDLADAKAQVNQIRAWWAGRAGRAERKVATSATGTTAPPNTPAAEPSADPASSPALVGDHAPAAGRAPRLPAIAIVECDSNELSSVARAHGGSRGALFTATLARIAVRIGRVAPGAEVPVATPVSMRGVGDDRANSTRIAMVRLPAAVLAGRDLASVRILSETAYGDLTETSRELDPVPLAAIQALPDVAARRLPQPPAAAVLATNMGRIPTPMAEMFGMNPRTVFGLVLHCGGGVQELLSIGGGVTGWMTEHEGRSVLVIVAADPAHTPDDAGLAALVSDEAIGWGLNVQPW